MMFGKVNDRLNDRHLVMPPPPLIPAGEAKIETDGQSQTDAETVRLTETPP